MGNFSEALSYAAALCSASEQCAQDILKKTEKFELTEADKALLIERLENEHFIDKKRYVHAFVMDKFRYSKWGKVKIQYMLRQKGLDNDSIEQGLNSIDEESYKETLCALLVQKKRGVRFRNAYELQTKLYRFALGRGFEPSVTAACLKQVNVNTDEQDINIDIE